MKETNMLRMKINDMNNALWQIEKAKRDLVEWQRKYDDAIATIKDECPILLEHINVLDLPSTIVKKLTDKGYMKVYQLRMFDPWRLPKGIGAITYDKIRVALHQKGVPNIR